VEKAEAAEENLIFSALLRFLSDLCERFSFFERMFFIPA
jgi:hypothetical protein